MTDDGSAPKLVNGHYLLQTNSKAEKPRLDRQWLLFRKYFQSLPLPLDLDVENLVVLDVAAGSLAWTVDVALRNPSANIRFYACDILSDNFPHSDVLEKLAITTFVHDATQPFPVEMKGMFDVVNMRLVTAAFSESQWKSALGNIHDVLKPQGRLLLQEPDIVSWTCEEALAGSKMTETWLTPYNQMFLKHAEFVKFVPNPSERLPHLLRDASFVVETQTTAKFPLGAACKSFRSVKGASLEDEEEFSGRMSKMITKRYAEAAFSEGLLTDAEGKSITEAARLAFMDKYDEAIDVQGALFIGTEIIAVKA